MDWWGWHITAAAADEHTDEPRSVCLFTAYGVVREKCRFQTRQGEPRPGSLIMRPAGSSRHRPFRLRTHLERLLEHQRLAVHLALHAPHQRLHRGRRGDEAWIERVGGLDGWGLVGLGMGGASWG